MFFNGQHFVFICCFHTSKNGLYFLYSDRTLELLKSFYFYVWVCIHSVKIFSLNDSCLEINIMHMINWIVFMKEFALRSLETQIDFQNLLIFWNPNVKISDSSLAGFEKSNTQYRISISKFHYYRHTCSKLLQKLVLHYYFLDVTGRVTMP